MATMDDIIRQMLEEQYTLDDSSGLQLQPGLLGTPSENNALDSLQSKSQASSQQMADLGKQAISNGIQAAQSVQNAQQASMNDAQRTLSQAVQQQQAQEAQLGNILGKAIKNFSAKSGTDSASGGGMEETPKADYSAGIKSETPMTVEGVDINQQATPSYSGGAKLTPGLLGETPASTQMTPVNANAGQAALDKISAKSQAASQQMQNMQQQAISDGLRASQQLQTQRQADMNATAQQAAQMAQQQAQKEQQQGQIFGTLLKMYLTGGIG